MRIEICGAIGSGKTTLARLMSPLGLTVCHENFKMNPFWEAFYLNPGKFAFETELTFLLQHYHQIRTSSSSTVFDFCLYQDLAFAKMGLSGRKMELFEDAYKICIEELGPPDLVVFLRCPVQMLKKRIQIRGRSEEQNISADFLNALIVATEKEFLNNTPAEKRITIDSDSLNFLDTVAQNKVLEMLSNLIHG